MQKDPKEQKPRRVSAVEFLLLQSLNRTNRELDEMTCKRNVYRACTYLFAVIGIILGVLLWQTPPAELCKSSKPYKVKHLAVYQSASLPPHLVHQAPTSAEIWTIYQVKALWKKEAMGDTSCLLAYYKLPKVLKTKLSDYKSGSMNTANALIATNCNPKANLNSHLTTV